MKSILVFTISGIIAFSSLSHAQTSTPVIEPCDCPVKVDSTYKTRCGYLVVPENRKKNNSKMIRLPFMIVKSKNPDRKRSPLLFTTGGPGGSSLGWVNGAIRNAFTEDRDCIAFEQRGTRFAIPNVWSEELALSIQESYRKNLSKDSMVLVGIRQYKKALEARGIDLSGYNTDETVTDIHALLKALKIDSVNLIGGSYSGGLMLAVLQKDPTRIRSLVLDSPLPTFIPIDEDEPANFNEALDVLFRHCEKDSVNKELYGDLKRKFQEYFLSIENKAFYIPYVEKNKDDALNVQYTRNDLLNVIENRLLDYPKIKEIPYVITELIKGHHAIYIKELLDDIFNNKPGPSGMRISVYCADQTAYHDESILHQLNNAYPYMKGYHINDVYREMCDCWKVPAISRRTKQPYYSGKPVLLGDGEMDPACRPLYIDMIHHYMPNSQRLLYINRSHMVFGGKESCRIIRAFLDNPLRKIETGDKDIIVY